MTFSVQIQGHDDLQGELKEAFENGLVAKVSELIADAQQDGVTFTAANVTTNTTGSLDILGSNEAATDGAAEEESEAVEEDDT
jgi:hypothetical protein